MIKRNMLAKTCVLVMSVLALFAAWPMPGQAASHSKKPSHSTESAAESASSEKSSHKKSSSVSDPFFRIDRDSADAWQKKLSNVRIFTDTVHMSGSAQFSAGQFHDLAETLREKVPGEQVYVIDLREESHAFLNGIAVSWYGSNNQVNKGMPLEDVLADEKARFGALPGQTIQVYKKSSRKKKADGSSSSRKSEAQITVETVMYEQELAEQEGFGYLRIPVTDHTFPTPDEVDMFINFVKSIDPNHSHLHFHCHAGRGRTGIYMMLYDKMRNPGLSDETIIERQVSTGSSNPMKGSEDPDAAKLMPLLFRYVEENQAAGYPVAWSEWLPAHRM